MANTIKELQHLSIPFEDIDVATKKFTTVIGKGGYGNVYKGELFHSSGKPTTVAVKRLSSNISDQGFKEFLTEIKLLSRYKHPNLISLLGFCEEGNEKILIYEHAVRGSLDKYLSSDGKATPPPLTWAQRINICIDAARGLDYLHNHVGKFHKIIHRDIKSANILLDRSWKAMLSDLGLSKIGLSNENDSYLITNACGTHGYCDPVYRDTGILTKESDVYSFGVVLFEVLCGRLCFMDVPNERRFLDRLAPRYYEIGRLNEIIDIELKDQIGSTSLNIIADIAYECLQNDREKRPSMDLVVKKLEEARESHIRSEVAERIEILLHKLNSVSPDDQRTAAGEIRLLAKKNAGNRVALAEAGAIPLLTHLLTALDSRTQEHAVSALLNLSICEDNKGSIVSSGAVPGIVQVLKTGSMEALENAAATLFSLSIIDENKVTIGFLGAIPPLVLLLSEGTQRGKRHAAEALFNLCIYQDNKGRAVRAGVVPTLMGLLTEPESVMKDEALAILDIISIHPEGKLAIAEAEAVPVLVEFIGNGSPRNKENAADILVHLCSANQKYLVEAEEVGVMGLLVDLIHHGTDRGKRKAGQLLEMMTSLESFVRKLNSVSPDDQRTAAGEIRLLAKENADNRVALAEAGAIPLLRNLLTSPDPRTQEHAVTALLNLSICEDNKWSIVSSGAVPGIVQVLRTGSMEARENAAATLFSLSVIDENKVAIGNLGAIPPLVLLLSEGTQRGKKDAATALFNLCIYHGNKGRAVRAGVVPILMGHFSEPESVMKDEALAILAIISSHPEGKLAIGQVEAVPVLVEFIGNGSPRNKENAAAILVNLCSADQKYMMEAQEVGVMGVLVDLLHHGTDRGKIKAGQLLEMMTRLAEVLC